MGSLSRLPLPSEFQRTAARIERELPRLCGANLVGIYLYGSALDPAFVPGRSDFDCIGVTAEPIDSSLFERLRDWFDAALAADPAFKRVQMSWLVKGWLLVDEPSACLYQFGALGRPGSDGNPIIWLDHYQRGAVLHGLDPNAFVPEITPSVLRRALVRELGYLREEMISKRDSEWRDRPSYRAYAVLTLCRILYSHGTGTVASKPVAAAWVREQAVVDAELDPIIEQAVRMNDQRGSADIPMSSIKSFIRHCERQLGLPAS